MRFKNHGVAPKSAADFAFLLHGLHYLKDDGVMAIILPHGVLFRGGVEERIRTKLLKDGHIDTVIGLPANLFYSTGIPVCILVLKKCKKPDDVLFINAAEHFVKGKRQNQLTDEHIERILETYQKRPAKPIERYARRVEMKEIVNTKIKFREPYRPFAPSVTQERAGELFDLAEPERHYPARFMLLVVPVRASAAQLIPAVTHVDGSARLQIVVQDTKDGQGWTLA